MSIWVALQTKTTPLMKIITAFFILLVTYIQFDRFSI